MNYRRGSAVSGVLFVLFLSLTLALSLLDRPKEAEESIEVQEVQVLDVHVGDVAALALTHGDVRFGLIHRAPKIIMEPALEAESLSQEELRAFLYRFSKLSAVGSVSPSQGLEAYGLDAPRALVTLIMNDGEKVRLYLGSKNPVNNSSYLLKEGEDVLFLVSEADTALFTRSPRDFRSRRVLPQIEAGDVNRVREVSLSFASGERQDFLIEQASPFEFRLAEPFEYTLDYQRVLSNILMPLTALTADETLLTSEAADLLDTPGFRLSVLLGQERYSLAFLEGENAFFVLNEAAARVYKIAKENAPWADLNYVDLLSRAVYHANISEIDSILIRDGAREYDLKLEGQTTELTGILNGVGIEYSAVTEFYNSLFETGIAGVVEQENPIDEVAWVEPSFAVEVFKKSGAIDVVGFYAKNDEEMFVAVNGSVHLTTYKRSIELVRSEISRLLN